MRKVDTFAQLRSDNKLDKIKLIATTSMLAAGYLLVAITVGPNPFEGKEMLNLWVYEGCEEPRRIEITTNLDANTVQVDFIMPATEGLEAPVDPRCANVHLGSNRRFEIAGTHLFNQSWGGKVIRRTIRSPIKLLSRRDNIERVDASPGKLS